ncbi:MAG: type II toxin-antitoxin system RatA family toxin [Endomicrobiales bacterium]
MITRDSMFIRAALPDVYACARDLEKQHEFIPGYMPAEVTVTDAGETVVTRAAEIDGKTMRWRSRVFFRENVSIGFEQIEGRLKGMKIEWLFEQAPGGTKVTIVHDVRLKVPLLGRVIERLAVKPVIDRLTAGVLAGLKRRMEGGS